MHLRPSFAPARALILLALPLLGCSEKSAPAAATSSAALPASAAPPSAAAAAPEASVAAAEPPREIAGAAQILVAYKGAELAAKSVIRSKDAAKKRAAEALGKITRDHLPFEEAAKKYSDDASKDIGGAIGNFERNAMPAAFSATTFALKVGDVSEVVESPRGFHIIKRTR